MRGERRIVITGLGCVSPVGNDVGAAWSALCNGESGIGPLTAFDAEAFPARIAGEVKDFDVDRYLSSKEARISDPFIHYGMAASIQAIEDAGLEAHPREPERYGLAIGSGIGGIHTIEQAYSAFLEKGPRKISPFFVPGCIINMIAGNISIRYGYQGPNISIVTACTTATHNIGQAARIIAYGDADVMLAGGAEYGTTPTAYGGFTAARALSTRNDNPTGASRPWDRGRDGFVLSNGAGVVVLESLDHAMARGAEIYGEVLGFGMSGDAHHMTAPPEDGAGAARCMRLGIQDAGLSPRDINYINAHGTSTPVGDTAEVAAVKSVFGAHSSDLLISSTKSMTGHMLGAAGGIELIATVLSLKNGVIPPTINLEDPDPVCEGLDLVPSQAREADIKVAISNSFGFGGTNGSLVVARFQ